MYTVSGPCGYCKKRCSRSGHEEDRGLPILITPESPFIKEIVCELCWRKLKDKLTDTVDEIMKNE